MNSIMLYRLRILSTMYTRIDNILREMQLKNNKKLSLASGSDILPRHTAFLIQTSQPVNNIYAF
jgi:hypothetical protein